MNITVHNNFSYYNILDTILYYTILYIYVDQKTKILQYTDKNKTKQKKGLSPAAAATPLN